MRAQLLKGFILLGLSRDPAILLGYLEASVLRVYMFFFLIETSLFLLGTGYSSCQNSVQRCNGKWWWVWTGASTYGLWINSLLSTLYPYPCLCPSGCLWDLRASFRNSIEKQPLVSWPGITGGGCVEMKISGILLVSNQGKLTTPYIDFSSYFLYSALPHLTVIHTTWFQVLPDIITFCYSLEFDFSQQGH